MFVTGAGQALPVNAGIGFADADAKRPMTADTPLRIASNTKTFVAAAALRLWEQGKLDLDSPIGPLLTPVLDAIVRADGYDTAKITLRQLMSHSAGFYDHGADPKYIGPIAKDPAHLWTREEQVRKSMEWGDPVGKPGSASAIRTPATSCSATSSSAPRASPCPKRSGGCSSSTIWA